MISNKTSEVSYEQVEFIVQQGCIRPLCDLVTMDSGKMVAAALGGLENMRFRPEVLCRLFPSS